MTPSSPLDWDVIYLTPYSCNVDLLRQKKTGVMPSGFWEIEGKGQLLSLREGKKEKTKTIFLEFFTYFS